MSKKEKTKKNNLADQSFYDDYKNAIPADKIWEFQVEGLQKPQIGGAVSHAFSKKLLVVVILVIAIAISIFFSFWILHNDPFKYTDLEDGGIEFTRFSNPGDLLELKIDSCVTDIRSETVITKNENGEEVRHYDYTLTRDETRPITAVREYAFNCDEKIRRIEIGPGVTDIDDKAFYSCYALREIRVDPENPNYCDIDGVLFNKDKTVLMCYPIDHDAYLREKYGYTEQYWPTEDWKAKGLDKYNDKYTEQYEAQVNTYFVPDTVKTVGPLAFNYSELFHVYLPEGLERLETLAFFRNWHLEQIETYDGDFADAAKSGPDAKAPEIKESLPDSLTYIGSDCFNSAIEMDYMYIPANVTYIGHHAFWGAARKEKGGLIGLYEIHVALDEAAFKAQVDAGDQWTGQYDNGLFPKNVPVVYGEARR